MSNKKLIIGTLIIIGIALSWVISTQINQRIQTTDSFFCPFFIIWFSTSWISVCLLPPLLKKKKLVNSLAENRLSLKNLFLFSIFFYILWIVANYLYVISLKFMSASDVTAIFSSANAFVFIFSIFLLKEKINFIKSASVTLSISGIILIAMANASFGGSAFGIILTLFSAISAALYKVFLKKILQDPHLIVTSLFLGFLGIINVFFAWPIVLILIETNVEILVYEQIPWKLLVLGAISSFFFNLLVNFGIAYTYPLFISIGTIVGIPLNIVVDIIINGNDIDWKRIFGACLIIAGFVCLLVNNYLTLWYPEKIKEKLFANNIDKKNINEKLVGNEKNKKNKYSKTAEVDFLK